VSVTVFGGLLATSWRRHRQGRLHWKGRILA
jgi:hypothetical protein